MAWLKTHLCCATELYVLIGLLSDTKLNSLCQSEPVEPNTSCFTAAAATFGQQVTSDLHLIRCSPSASQVKSFIFAWGSSWPLLIWIGCKRGPPDLPGGLTWVSTSVSLRVCSADWLRRLVPISSMAAVWVCTAVLFISSIPERTFSWMKFSSCEENKQT